jgi:hypothetical protein
MALSLSNWNMANKSRGPRRTTLNYLLIDLFCLKNKNTIKLVPKDLANCKILYQFRPSGQSYHARQGL